jgi:hypothetical protein
LAVPGPGRCPAAGECPSSGPERERDRERESEREGERERKRAREKKREGESLIGKLKKCVLAEGESLFKGGNTHTARSPGRMLITAHPWRWRRKW